MSDIVKPRRYHAPKRAESAQQTRLAILTAATGLFVEQGYAATTMASIAEAAGVAVDTLYAVVGGKAKLFRLVVEGAISGEARAVAPEERDYVQEMQVEPDAARKLAIYAAAIRRIQGRLTPIFRVVQQAAPSHPELAALWNEISDRRAANMLLLVEELVATGRVRPDLTVKDAADIIWATNSPEMYGMLVLDRGWSPDRFEQWLADSWKRLLLDSS